MRGKTEMKIRDKQGAAAVEFAIVLPLLLTILFGIVEFSIALYDKAMITNASREGARFGIIFNSIEDPDHEGEMIYQPATEAEIEAVVNNYLTDNLISFGESSSADTTAVHNDINGGGIGSGDELSITVDYTYNFLVLPNFVGDIIGPLNLRARTIMRME